MRLCLALFLALLLCAPAHAQWVRNDQTASINGSVPCPAGGFTRSFDVGTPGTVADVDLGLDANHSWRGDISARLVSPTGLAVQVLRPDPSASGNFDNYRIRLDDAAAVDVNQGTHAINTAANAPSYGDRVRPSNPLSAFNGQPADGVWTLEVCDDYPAADNGQLLNATLFITPVSPPAAPAFSCAGGASPLPLVWSAPGTANGWDAGTLVNGYSVGTAPDDVPLSFAITGDTGNLVPRGGQQTPVSSTALATEGEHAVILNADFANTAQSVTLTANLGTAGAGVGGVRFGLRDVDRRNWADRVGVAATLSGSAVPVSLTPSLANRVNGSAIDGTAAADSGDTAGSATVTVLQPLDQLTLTYTNGPDAPADPASQVIGFFADLVVCPLPPSGLTAVKTVELPAPAVGPLLMVPGQDVIYRITVEHEAGSTTNATDIAIEDALPPTLLFVSSAQTGFSAGTFANQNCPGPGCTVRFENGALPIGETGEIVVTATIR